MNYPVRGRKGTKGFLLIMEDVLWKKVIEKVVSGRKVYQLLVVGYRPVSSSSSRV